ncbi:MAG: Fis family transcriptional regulator [Polyangiaceae bacterium]|jgi:transcriptional regulator with GAF, ATPase, and Fis domain|nr:Fis family transcriptional regulator [Polyangiaceae bacterium]
MQLDALQSLALSVAQARSPDSVLMQMVQGLGMWDGVALARVWLLRDTEHEPPYLELKASIGASIAEPSRRWNRTDGAHQKILLSYGKVGYIASNNRPLLLQRGPRDWLVQPDWADAEGIQSFAGQPLCFKGQVLGVVAFFSRRRLEKADLDWLRVFADHAAVAIANARAFEEIARLKESAERERDYLREAVRSALQHGDVVAESPEMKRVLAQVQAVARTDSSVLILGESGVGKELIAAAVHDQSGRRDGPLVKVNCASVPRELFESEFFGHVRGAFSGAARDRQGRFLLADRGSLFLDEVGEIPLELQGKLLRVLQERTFEAVGDDRTREADVRVIAATNRPLDVEVERGRFRRDLFYRLNVLPIEVPPLRQRRADIVPMARRFLRTTAHRLHLPERELSAEDERALLAYDFPGNVRELQNIIERAVVLSTRAERGLGLELGRVAATDAVPAARREELDASDVMGEDAFRELERRNVLNALRRCGYRIAGERGAAKLLGLSPSTLTYRMKQLGLERPR